MDKNLERLGDPNSFKTISLGIGLGNLRPKRDRKIDLDTIQIEEQTTQMTLNPSDDVGEIPIFEKKQPPSGENNRFSMFRFLLWHTTDLIFISVSMVACVVAFLYLYDHQLPANPAGILSNITSLFSDFNITPTEALGFIYFVFFVYFLIFRWLVGQTLGEKIFRKNSSEQTP